MAAILLRPKYITDINNQIRITEDDRYTRIAQF